MEEKRYLKWYNKVGYGAGDLAANCVYSVLACFILIYLLWMNELKFEY